MHIGIAGPISLGPLKPLLPGVGDLPKTYSFPLIGELAARIAESGHRLTVFAGADEITRPEKVENERLSIVFVPRRKRRQAYDWYRFERKGLEQEIQKSSCDIIHAHWSYEFAAAALSSGKPCLVTIHDSPRVVARFYRNTRAALFWWMRSMLGKKVLARAPFVSGVSPYILENARPLMKRLKEGRVIPNGVDSRLFQMGLNRPGFTPHSDDFRIYSILEGFGIRKNATTAIQAFASVKKRIPGAEFHLVGSGYEHGGPAYQWALRKGIAEGCVFRGYVEHKLLFPEISARANLLLHPSLEESFCMAILEAAALGIPVVASKYAGGPSYILKDGQLGDLVDTSSPQEITEAVLRISEKPDEAKTRAEKCRAFAEEKFTTEAMTRQYLQFYNDILRR